MDVIIQCTICFHILQNEIEEFSLLILILAVLESDTVKLIHLVHFSPNMNAHEQVFAHVHKLI